MVVEKMVLGGEHLFFSAQRGGENLLSIWGLTKENGALQASAVWMDSCYHRDKPAFKIGMQFQEEQDQVLAEIKAG